MVTTQPPSPSPSPSPSNDTFLFARAEISRYSEATKKTSDRLAQPMRDLSYVFRTFWPFFFSQFVRMPTVPRSERIHRNFHDNRHRYLHFFTITIDNEHRWNINCLLVVCVGQLATICVIRYTRGSFGRSVLYVHFFNLSLDRTFAFARDYSKH